MAETSLSICSESGPMSIVWWFECSGRQCVSHTLASRAVLPFRFQMSAMCLVSSRLSCLPVVDATVEVDGGEGGMYGGTAPTHVLSGLACSTMIVASEYSVSVAGALAVRCLLAIVSE